MAGSQNNSEASPEAVKEAQDLWSHFMTATKYFVIFTVIVLILMAIFLL